MNTRSTDRPAYSEVQNAESQQTCHKERAITSFADLLGDRGIPPLVPRSLCPPTPPSLLAILLSHSSLAPFSTSLSPLFLALVSLPSSLPPSFLPSLPPSLPPPPSVSLPTPEDSLLSLLVCRPMRWSSWVTLSTESPEPTRSIWSGNTRA